MGSRIGVVLFALAAYVHGETAVAVEPAPVRISERYRIVGVIGGDHDYSGVAVIRNVSAGKTYTLSIGDQVPGEENLWIESVGARKVEVTDGKKVWPLAYTEPSSHDEADTEPVSFIENYYRGLSESPVQLRAGSTDPLNQGGGAPGADAVSRVGTMAEESSSRFDLYRMDRRYDEQADSDLVVEENANDEPFVVSYDNFADEQTGDGAVADNSGSALALPGRGATLRGQAGGAAGDVMDYGDAGSSENSDGSGEGLQDQDDQGEVLWTE